MSRGVTLQSPTRKIHLTKRPSGDFPHRYTRTERIPIMKISISAVALFLCLTCPTFAATDYSKPFGDITDTRIDEFRIYAKTKGLDVIAEMEDVYEKNELAALGRVFQFSTNMSDFDMNAQTYGQIIFNSLFNLGEAWNCRNNDPCLYFSVLSAQSPQVQQRIRDFLYYAFTFVPPEEKDLAEKEARKSTIIFPSGYVFGKGDPIFRNFTSTK